MLELILCVAWCGDVVVLRCSCVWLAGYCSMPSRGVVLWRVVIICENAALFGALIVLLLFRCDVCCVGHCVALRHHWCAYVCVCVL